MTTSHVSCYYRCKGYRQLRKCCLHCEILSHDYYFCKKTYAMQCFLCILSKPHLLQRISEIVRRLFKILTVLKVIGQ